MGATTNRKPWRRLSACADKAYWSRLLWDRATTMYEWKGLPPTINLTYLEAVLQTDGHILFVKDNNGNLRAIRGAAFGFDCYGWPTEWTVDNPVLGHLSGKVGENGVLMLNTPYGESSVPIVEKYAGMLEEIDSDIKVNLFNVKTARIFPVKNEGEAQQIRRMLDTVTETSVPAYLVNDSIMQDIKDSQPITSPLDYLGKDLSEGKILTLNEFYATFGYNCTQIVKRERLTDDEVQSNNEQIELNKAMFLDPRRKAIAELQRVFGVSGVSVDLNRGEESSV